MDEDGEYDGPTRIPMSRYAVEKYSKSIESKGFTDLLGPVKRYFFGKIGCRWDDVYSELSEALGSGSYPVRHILTQHILNRRAGLGEPLRFFVRGGEFVVDDQGLVQYRTTRSWRNREQKKYPIERVQAGEQWFVRIDGIWYIGRFVRVDAAEHEKEVEWPDYREGWGKGAKICRFEKLKQANKKELKRLDSVSGTRPDGL